MVQSHGDYHPNNILVAQGTHDDHEYVAAIDFPSSYRLLRALDVGTFLAQHINMFFDYHGVQRHAPAEIFLQTYYADAGNLDEDFTAQMELYKARICPSVLYYLTKVAMGDSENFLRVMVEAEKCLASFEARKVS
jgi:aminoglycoside phosphotransferase (APT) family kinase protein